MTSATNSILTGLAVSDMLVMLDYIPFSLHFHVHADQSDERMYSYYWTLFALFHAHFTCVCHAISTWLTVLLAIWRYLSVRHPVKARAWCSQQRAHHLIFATYVAVIICCIPVYLSFTIIQRHKRSETYVVSIQLPSFTFLSSQEKQEKHVTSRCSLCISCYKVYSSQ